MRVTTTKSKKSESFYITKSFKNSNGKSSSVVVRKLGTLNVYIPRPQIRVSAKIDHVFRLN